MGASADAYHITAPHPEGLGARLAMAAALTQAGLAPEEVDAVNMHATSTPLGDVSESHAVRAFFGAHADRLTATSTKSMTGHLLGAAGAVEAIASVLSIVHGVVPPTINLERPDPARRQHRGERAGRAAVRVAISNAFGSAGTIPARFRAVGGSGDIKVCKTARTKEKLSPCSLWTFRSFLSSP